MKKMKIAVTGMGAVTSLGFGTDEIWKSMVSGKTGIRELSTIDTSEYKTKVGSEVDSNRLTETLKGYNFRSYDRAVDLALVASAQALEQADLGSPWEPKNIPVIMGTGVGAAGSLFAANSALHQKGLKGIRPTTVPRCMANAISSQISLQMRLSGINYVVVSACTSSTIAIGLACRMINDGYADTVLCGGADSFFDPLVFGAWNQLGVMSQNPEADKACRPFDANRDGCVLGEGAAVLVLESSDTARARGVNVLAEIIGYGESSDAKHITSPDPEGQTKAMMAALSSAGVSPSDISLINAHGTATRANDECECKSIKMVFGDLTGSIPVVSNKSYFGHMLGAAGAMETIVSIRGLNEGLTPGNLNLDTPDPDCDLSFVPGKTTEIKGKLVMKNSFGFGGANGVLIISGNSA